VPGHRSTLGNEADKLARQASATLLPDKLARQASATLLPGPDPVLGIPRCSVREAVRTWTVNQHHCAWKYLPGHRHGNLFISGPCKKRADYLFKLNSHKLKMVVAILTGHASVRTHLRTLGLFEGDPTRRFCRKEAETVQHIICRCEVLARWRFNGFENLTFEAKVIITASGRDLCLFIRGTGLLRLAE
jgi:hypothetical protein